MNDIDIKIYTIQKSVVGECWKGVELHTDPYCRLYFITGGTGRIETRGRIWELKKGYSYLLDTHHPFRLIDSPTLEHYWIHFRCTVLDNISLFNFISCPVELKCSHSGFFGEMLKHTPASNAADEIYIQGLFRLLLAEFLGQSTDRHDFHNCDSERFRPALQYMNQNLSNEISVSKLAKICHLHPNYFSNVFTENFGMSPLQYILQRRIHTAQMLLWETDMTVAQIGYDVGYSDNCYFSRIFKKHTGIAPGQYRAQKKAMEPPGLR